jgi:hypothetical protein
MSADEVRTKFRENAALALHDASLTALEEAVLSLEDHDELRAVFSGLTAGKVAV